MTPFMPGETATEYVARLEAEVDRLQAGANMARYWREQYDLLRAHMERIRAAVESHTPQDT